MCSANAAPPLLLDRDEVRVGSWIVVQVPGVRGPATAMFLGRRVPMFAAGGGLRALVPVPLGSPGGRARLEVLLPSGTLRAAVTVVARAVKPREMLDGLTVSERTATALKAGNAVLSRAWRETGPEPLWASPLRHPLQGRLTSGYGNNRSYAGTAQWAHRGIDIGAPDGWPVVAAAAGRVVVSRMLEAYGNAVVLDHGQTVHTAYFHMRSREVAVGVRVEAGQVVGTVGDTGLAKGSHLHFGTYIGAVAVDPEEVLSRGLP